MNREELGRLLAAAETIEQAASTIESNHGLWRLAEADRKNLVERLEKAVLRAEAAASTIEDAATIASRASLRFEAAAERRDVG